TRLPRISAGGERGRETAGNRIGTGVGEEIRRAPRREVVARKRAGRGQPFFLHDTRGPERFRQVKTPSRLVEKLKNLGSPRGARRAKGSALEAGIGLAAAGEVVEAE